MVNFYRVRLKQKGLEVEVESCDKGFVEETLTKYVPRMGIKNDLIEIKPVEVRDALTELHKEQKDNEEAIK